MYIKVFIQKDGYMTLIPRCKWIQHDIFCRKGRQCVEAAPEVGPRPILVIYTPIGSGYRGIGISI